MLVCNQDVLSLLQISPGDIEWVGEDPGIGNRFGYNGQQGHGLNRTPGPSSVPQRGSGLAAKNSVRKDFRTPQNGTGKRKHPDIRIRQTDTLIREVGITLLDHNLSLTCAVMVISQIDGGFLIGGESSWFTQSRSSRSRKG